MSRDLVFSVYSSGQQFPQQNFPNQQQYGGQNFAPGAQGQGNFPQGQGYNQNMGQQQYGQFQGQGQRFPAYNRPQGNMNQGGNMPGST